MEVKKSGKGVIGELLLEHFIPVEQHIEKKINEKEWVESSSN